MPNVAIVGTSLDAKGGISSVLRGFKSLSSQSADYSFEFITSHDDLSAFEKVKLAYRAAVELERRCASGAVDIVHVHSGDRASLVRLAIFGSIAKKYGVPLINHVHCADWDAVYAKAPLMQKRLLEEAYSYASITVALSQKWKDNLAQVVPDDSIRVLENFVERSERNTASISEKTILFSGRLEKIKGTDIIPSVVKRVLSRNPDALFLIAGEGTQREGLRQACMETGVDANVSLLGWCTHETMEALYRKSNIVFLPSYGEGMPMTVLEGIGFGKPVVTTDVGGNAELVNSENGALLPAGDVDGLADAISRILESPEMYCSMSLKSNEIASTRTLDNYKKNLEEIYGELSV